MLTIRFKVPIVRDGDMSERASGGITFASWLPESKEKAVKVEKDNLVCEIWFDKSVIQPTVTQMSDTKYWTPMEAQFASGFVTVTGISEPLKRYIESSREQREIHEVLEDEHQQLATNVVHLIIDTYNRIVQYVRNYLGQYWVTETALRSSAYEQCLRLKCRVPIDGDLWLLFAPRRGNSMLITVVLDTSRHINEKNWAELCSFVEQNKKSPRYKELFTGAEEIKSYGHNRAALLEAIAALESALQRFAQSPNAEKLYGHKLKSRMESASLTKQVQHMGFSGSIGFLLPVILDEALLPTAIVEGCRIAIEVRNNVVHNGQRDIKPDVLNKSLSSIRGYCAALEAVVNNPE